MKTFATSGVHLQTGEYATDEEEEMSPMFPNSIEVFDLAENQEALSPVEMDPEKLAHKFKEVFGNPKESFFWEGVFVVLLFFMLICFLFCFKYVHSSKSNTL